MKRSTYFLLMLNAIVITPIFCDELPFDILVDILSKENYEKHIANQQMFSYRSLASGDESFQRYKLNEGGFIVVNDDVVAKRNSDDSAIAIAIKDYPYQSLYDFLLINNTNTKTNTGEQIIPESNSGISTEGVFALFALLILICAVDFFCVRQVRRNNLRNLVYLISMKTADTNPGKKKNV